VHGSSLGKRLADKDLIASELMTRLKDTPEESIGDLWKEFVRIFKSKNKVAVSNLLAATLTHTHHEREKTFVLSNKEVVNGGIVSICDQLANDEALALCSGVRLEEGYVAHLPMLDFACAPTIQNRNTVEAMLKTIGQTGAILESGNSFHFLGISLLATDQWVRFMGRSLLLAPYVDIRYTGHRLIDGEALLRLFARGKEQPAPTVKAIVNSSE